MILIIWWWFVKYLPTYREKRDWTLKSFPVGCDLLWMVPISTVATALITIITKCWTLLPKHYISCYAISPIPILTYRQWCINGTKQTLFDATKDHTLPPLQSMSVWRVRVHISGDHVTERRRLVSAHYRRCNGSPGRAGSTTPPRAGDISGDISSVGDW